MTSLIVDMSVLIQRFIQDTQTSNVVAMLSQVQPPDELCVPEFCILECINVLWKRVQFHGMPPYHAEQLLADLQKPPLRLLAPDVVYLDALKIGIQYNLAIYDSVYIALAKHLNYPLITVDQKQSTAALQENVTLKPITDFVQ